MWGQEEEHSTEDTDTVTRLVTGPHKAWALFSGLCPVLSYSSHTNPQACHPAWAGGTHR